MAICAAAFLLLTGCAGNQVVIEIPFGTSMDVMALVVSSVKTGEGEIVVNVINNAPEPLKVDVRLGRAEIGFDYNSSKKKKDYRIYSKWKVEWTPVTLQENETRDFIIRLTNTHDLSRTFTTAARVHVSGVKARWRFDIAVDDDDLFADSEFLRDLNRISYWHPKQIDENWRKYEAHIAQ